MQQLWLLPLCLIALLLQLAPLYLFCLTLFPARSSAFVLGATLVCIALFGYLSFWLYWLSPHLGYASSTVVPLVALAMSRWRHVKERVRDPLLVTPIGLWIAVTLFYCAIAYGLREPWPQPWAGYIAIRFLPLLPNDNTIPMVFADRLLTGSDPRHLVGDWLSSDRPPLQAGLALMQGAAWRHYRLFELHYQLAGVFMQAMFVPVAWLLLTVWGSPRRLRALVVLLVASSGFCLVNGTYVWPKLLAGALTLLPTVFVIENPRSRLANLFAAAAMALGLLAHMGSVFFALPWCVWYLSRAGRPSWRSAAMAAALGAALLAPWLGYQKVYEPPGDRLAKWHLANSIGIDSRGVLSTVADGYRAVGLGGALELKRQNLAFMVSERHLRIALRLTEDNALLERTADFFIVWRIFNVLLLGIPIIVWRSFRRRQRPAVVLLVPCYLVFAVLEFGGEHSSTSIEVGPYGLFLLTAITLLDALTERARWLLMVAIPYLAWFYFIWIWSARKGAEWSARGAILTLLTGWAAYAIARRDVAISGQQLDRA